MRRISIHVTKSLVNAKIVSTNNPDTSGNAVNKITSLRSIGFLSAHIKRIERMKFPTIFRKALVIAHLLYK